MVLAFLDGRRPLGSRWSGDPYSSIPFWASRGPLHEMLPKSEAIRNFDNIIPICIPSPALCALFYSSFFHFCQFSSNSIICTTFSQKMLPLFSPSLVTPAAHSLLLRHYPAACLLLSFGLACARHATFSQVHP